MFFDLLCGLFFVFPLHFKSWTVSGDGSYISLAHSWFSLFLVMLYCYSCRNNLILLGLFWANRLFQIGRASCRERVSPYV